MFFLFQIPPTVLETMLVHVENGYAAHGNPYHNHMHACDVLQTVHYFISQTGLAVSCVYVYYDAVNAYAAAALERPDLRHLTPLKHTQVRTTL